MDELIEKGKVVRGYLGVEMRDLTPTMAKKLGVTEGALVTNVSEGSAAEKGGVQVKDVIIRVNGKPVANGAQLRRGVESIAPGKSVEVVVVRDKKEESLRLTLDERPTDLRAAAQEDGGKLGLSVKPLTDELARQIGVDPGTEGVVVYKVESGSAANRANLQVNDVIMEIDDAPITSVASFTKAVKDLKSGDTAIVVEPRPQLATGPPIIFDGSASFLAAALNSCAPCIAPTFLL
jgi:serine protease Do